MQLLTITRRSGEQIPINPAQVCYVRQTGLNSSVYMANGEPIRVAVPAAELAAAIERALNADSGDRKHVAALEEPAPPGPEGLQGAPGEPQAAEDGPTEEEVAEVEGKAQRRQEAEDGHKGKK